MGAANSTSVNAATVNRTKRTKRTNKQPTKNNDRNRWSDVIAGLSIAGLLLPEAVAYASIGNLPPQAGVIALFAGLLCYGLLGTSRFAIVSATSSSAAVLAAATAAIANGNAGLRLTLAIGLVLVSGVFFLLASLARMGNVTDFIAKPVLRGFAFGLAIVIILKQCASVVGVQPVHSDLIRFIPELVARVAIWNWVGVAVTVVALILLFILARFKHIPGGLIVIALGIAASKWFNLSDYGIGMVGTIQLQLSTPSLPLLTHAEWLRIGELGFAMVMILYAESYGSIRTFAMKVGDNVSPNRDLMALGVSNLVSGLFHGMPVGAGYSATSANEAAGAKSRLAGWVAAAVVLAIVLTLLPSIALTPVPILAAIVIHAVSHTLNPALFRSYFAWHRDRLVVISAVICVLLLGVLDGLLAAIAISILMMLRQLSASSIVVLGRLEQSHDFVNIATYPRAKAISGILILRPNEPIFFANAERILSQARLALKAADASIHTVIISLEESPNLDSSSIEALLDFYRSVALDGRQLLLARLKSPVYDLLKGLGSALVPLKSLNSLSVDDTVRIAQADTSPTSNSIAASATDPVTKLQAL
ncbi:SulP family inorganic anion transporter [Glaciimonas sp. CA11.2]|uniref:SulP family inorganic anion transporter n=1 Tax=Glaciimonas sp. CA11.2 TaxID=3048601 RepID=UPI002AB4041B|nr:SulP family inorganic anion transporter [Glaciimonas sp. CA11.2]MDY7546831.1 SulP family inorganic anion transporter [Glaciimonas sp. CA11.2]MEB0163709.1 SulP family inorganic anion transporter [Glaciimonas sp. CA11.2]